MKMKDIWIVLGVIIIVGAVFTGIKFQKVKKESAKRMEFYLNQVETFDTTFGKMSYIDAGDGEAIISCHGICGGFDQAYDSLGERIDTYRIIAPSRFGYTGTDMPVQATIEDQAKAYVELLDHLKIDRAYILATSAGGTSAIEFALKYPERTKGLILFCSAYPQFETPEKEISYAGPPAFLCNDFMMWFFSPLFQPLMGMDAETIKMIMPFGDKKAGIVYDAKVTNTDMHNNPQQYDLRNLKVPVLILHAKDDKLSPCDLVEKWSREIPNCDAILFESGGHLMEGNSERIDEELDHFITK
ncbi:MAG: alpha/beta hydrolase [Clostridia bacterium]|nr:alpha/beta hydrolase [Clostridia bacterium]